MLIVLVGVTWFGHHTEIGSLASDNPGHLYKTVSSAAVIVMTESVQSSKILLKNIICAIFSWLNFMHQYEFGSTPKYCGTRTAVQF